MLDVSHPDRILAFFKDSATVLVTVETARGSTPRIAGTQMLVSSTSVLGTIGGGQLEYMAVDAARAMLAAGTPQQRLDIALGPQIGQCCGGHVTLLLSQMDAACAQAVASAAKALKQRQPSVYIFGAGHVGRALATAMLPLPVNSLLIDSREDELALAQPTIMQDLTPLPEAHVRQAPSGSAFVVLTHDHALDFLITREALARQDAAYVGMIGSKTKRATFARWLEDETGSRETLERLTMPIGASRLSDKRPAVIAAMVCAQVMEAVGTFETANAQARSRMVQP